MNIVYQSATWKPNISGKKKKAEMEKTHFPTVKSQQVKSTAIYNSFKETENPLN